MWYDINPIQQDFLLAFAVIFALALAIYTVKKQSQAIIRMLGISLIGFLVVYFPIFEMWIIGKMHFWPKGFVPGPEGYGLAEIANFKFLNFSYFLMSTISTIFLIYSIVLLINLVSINAEKNKRWDSIKLRIPIANILFLGREIVTQIKASLGAKLLVYSWMLLAAFWVFFKFLANPLIRFKVNSYSLIDKLFFGDRFVDRLGETGLKLRQLSPSPIGYDYASIFVMSNMIVAMVTFLAGWFTLAILVRMKKEVSIS